MRKSLKSLKIFEYRFQRFSGSKKTDSLYRDLLNNIFNIKKFEYLSRVGLSREIECKKKRKRVLLKFSKIWDFYYFLIDKMTVKIFENGTQRFSKNSKI